MMVQKWFSFSFPVKIGKIDKLSFFLIYVVFLILGKK